MNNAGDDKKHQIFGYVYTFGMILDLFESRCWVYSRIKNWFALLVWRKVATFSTCWIGRNDEDHNGKLKVLQI